MSAERVEQLWEASKLVLADCALENGAIVAANSDLSVYPAAAENYRFVWGRDNAFQLVAADMQDVPEAAQRRRAYLGWLTERAEGFSETGVIVKRYSTNGNLDWRYGREHQPDQAGALLWALTETQTDPDKLTDDTVRLLANGLSSLWDTDHFAVPTQDLWENRTTNPEIRDSFTYSLAAAAHGLQRAISLWRGKTGETDKWGQTSEEMTRVLNGDPFQPYHLRKKNVTSLTDPDNTLDASLNGLVYPFSASATMIDPVLAETTSEIDRRLCNYRNGVLRYDGDTYDGIVRPGGGEAQAGRWPLLTFWHAVALQRTGQPDAARALYDSTIATLDELYQDKVLPNNLIPEQLFTDERQGKAVLPLAWSHAMFVIATKELEVL